MIRVGLCEDLDEDAARITALLHRHARCAKWYRVSRYISGGQLLHEYEEDASPFDLLLLDIEMPGMDGLETARRLREVDKQVPIIFITVHNRKQYLYAGYKVRPLDYISKPVNRAELFRALDDAESAVSFHRREMLLIRRYNSTYSIPIREVEYMQKDRHATEIVTKQKRLRVRSSLKALQDFCGPGFIMLNRSTCANVYWILGVDSQTGIATMNNGEEIQVSRYRLDDVVRQIIMASGN